MIGSTTRSLYRRSGLASTSALSLHPSLGQGVRPYAAKAASGTSSSSSGDNEGPIASTSLPSAAPPGTVLSGVSILKDKSDPIALEDSEYPPWLFQLLDDPSISSASSLASIEMAGMSKGEARAAQKRQSKVMRAAQLAKEKAEAKAAANARESGKTDTTTGKVNPENLTNEEILAQQAKDMASDVLRGERERKKALRKANKEAIKARNFVSAS